MLISNGSAACMAYDPFTGKEIWRIIRGEDSTISMPFTEQGLVYFYTGFITSPEKDRFAELMAVDPDGTGNIIDTHLKWRKKTPILQLSTPVIKEGYIYTVDTKSILMCLNAKTGETVWSKRVIGKYNSSPVYADGKLYFSSTRGETLVIREGTQLEILAANKLEGEIWATPAIVDNNLLIRTSEFLYRIGK
jgi:outer membrane protein assembly factor BamB